MFRVKIDISNTVLMFLCTSFFLTSLKHSAYFFSCLFHLHIDLCILGTETMFTHVKEVSEVSNKQTLLSIVYILPRSIEKAKPNKDYVLRKSISLRKFYLLWLNFFFSPQRWQIKARCYFLIITGYGNSETRNSRNSNHF